MRKGPLLSGHATLKSKSPALNNNERGFSIASQFSDHLDKDGVRWAFHDISRIEKGILGVFAGPQLRKLFCNFRKKIRSSCRPYLSYPK
jgi:hypothetical protein